MKTLSKGFTLIELMIVIAIIGILASIAVPQFGQYTKKARFADIIVHVAEYKSAVSMCAQDNDSTTPCDTDFGDIGPEITTPIGYLASLTVSSGTIIATGTSLVDNAVYKIVPAYSSARNTLEWTIDHTVTNACQDLNLCE